jgi:glycosyltransferase involved in cell wall biosynthesis
VKIIVYDDSPVFGGHQIMACRGIEALNEDPSVELLFMLNPVNEPLAQRLQKAAIPTCDVDAGLSGEHPDLLLCIQGVLTQSIRGVKAAQQAGIECVSYLALPHSMEEMHARFGRLRDRIRQDTVNLPDRYITISETMKQKLLSRGCRKPIEVVPNGVHIPTAPRTRGDLSSPSPCVLGLAGRIEFRQKRQDFIVNALKNHSGLFQGCQLLVAGNGPDEDELQELAAGMSDVALLPWQPDMESFYSRIDMLVIPSRYEGVPLVMLEALGRGIPVIGSSVDGMRELLPQQWTFEPGDTQAFARTLNEVRSTWMNDMPLLQQKIRDEYSLESYRSNFVRAVCSV